MRQRHVVTRNHDTIAVTVSDPLEEALPAIGAKAAQLAELGRVPSGYRCVGVLDTPRNAFAIPLEYSLWLGREYLSVPEPTALAAARQSSR